jgi:hypothetical protein
MLPDLLSLIYFSGVSFCPALGSDYDPPTSTSFVSSSLVAGTTDVHHHNCGFFCFVFVIGSWLTFLPRLNANLNPPSYAFYIAGTTGVHYRAWPAVVSFGEGCIFFPEGFFFF